MAYLQSAGEEIEHMYVRDRCSGAVREIGNGQNIFSPDYSLSSDGTMVAYIGVDLNTGLSGVYVASTETGAATLVASENYAIEPHLSPDGHLVEFSANGTGAVLDIYLVRPDGTDLRRVIVAGDYSNSAPLGPVSWTADSTAFTFSTGTTLYKVDADGSGVAVLWTSTDHSIYGGILVGANDTMLYFDSYADGSAGRIKQTWLCHLPCDTPIQASLTNSAGATLGISSMNSDGTLSYQVATNTGSSSQAVAEHELNPITGVDTTIDTAALSGANISSIDLVPELKPLTKPATCPTLELVGVRGSRGDAGDTSRSDSTITAVMHIIQNGTKGATRVDIDYPAIPIGFTLSYPSSYQSSVDAGEQALTEYVGNLSAMCPTTKIVIAGYSQGAQVAGDAAEQLTAPNRRNVAAVALLGDPKFNPAQSVTDRGDYDPGREGIMHLVEPIAGLHQIPDDFAGNVHSYCAAGDPICNYSAPGLLGCKKNGNACAHTQYEQLGWTTAAGAWVIQRLNSTN